MKKILALLLSAILVLSACAFAEELPVTHSHKLSNIYFISGDQIIDFSDLALEFDVSGVDSPDACRIHLDSEGQTAAELGLALVDGLFVCHLESDSLGHKDFSIDPVDLLARVLDDGIETITAMLQQVNTTELAQRMLGGLLGNGAAAGEAPEQPAEEAPAEETIEASLPTSLLSISVEDGVLSLSLMDVSMEIDDEVIALLEGCVSEPESVEMGGVDYSPNGKEIIIADGTYTSTEFDLSTETICKILDKVCVDGQPGGLGDMVREAGIDFNLHGSFLTGEAEGLNEIATINGHFNVDDTNLSVSASINKGYTEEGSVTTVSYMMGMGEQIFGIGFDLSTGTHEGEAFTSDSIDMDSALLLNDMDMEEAANTLIEALTQVGFDAMAAVIAPLANVDMSTLEAAE